MKINRELQTGTIKSKITPKKIEKGPADEVVLGGNKDAEFLSMGDKLKSMKSYGDDPFGDFVTDVLVEAAEYKVRELKFRGIGAASGGLLTLAGGVTAGIMAGAGIGGTIGIGVAAGLGGALLGGKIGKAIAKATYKSEMAEEPGIGEEEKPEPEVKPEPKPETKPEPKPETKPEPKPETKPETKPEPKPETKPEPKPEPLTKEDMTLLERLIKVEGEKYDAKGDLEFLKAKRPKDMSITEAGDYFCTLMNKAGYKGTGGARDLFAEIATTKKATERKEELQVALNLIGVEGESYDAAGDLSHIKNNKPKDMSITEAGDYFCTLMNKAGYKGTGGARDLFTEISSTENKEERKEELQVALKLIGVEGESYDAAGDLSHIKNNKPKDMSITEAGDYFCTLMNKAGYKGTGGARDLFTEISSTENKEERKEELQVALKLIGVEGESYDAAGDLTHIKNNKPKDMSITEAGDYFQTLMKKAGYKGTNGVRDLFTEISSTENKEERKEELQVALNLIGVEGESYDAAGDLSHIKNNKPKDMSITEAGDYFQTLMKKAGYKGTNGVRDLFTEISSTENKEEREEELQVALNLIGVEGESYDAAGDLSHIKNNKPKDMSITEAGDYFHTLMKKAGYKGTNGVRDLFTEISSTENKEEREEELQVALNLIGVEGESYDAAGDLTHIKNNKPKNMSITEAGNEFCQLMREFGYKGTGKARDKFSEKYNS